VELWRTLFDCTSQASNRYQMRLRMPLCPSRQTCCFGAGGWLLSPRPGHSQKVSTTHQRVTLVNNGPFLKHHTLAGQATSARPSHRPTNRNRGSRLAVSESGALRGQHWQCEHNTDTIRHQSRPPNNRELHNDLNTKSLLDQRVPNTRELGSSPTGGA